MSGEGWIIAAVLLILGGIYLGTKWVTDLGIFMVIIPFAIFGILILGVLLYILYDYLRYR